jgi:hypothetical protein
MAPRIRSVNKPDCCEPLQFFYGYLGRKTSTSLPAKGEKTSFDKEENHTEGLPHLHHWLVDVVDIVISSFKHAMHMGIVLYEQLKSNLA